MNQLNKNVYEPPNAHDQLLRMHSSVDTRLLFSFINLLFFTSVHTDMRYSSHLTSNKRLFCQNFSENSSFGSDSGRNIGEKRASISFISVSTWVTLLVNDTISEPLIKDQYEAT